MNLKAVNPRARKPRRFISREALRDEILAYQLAVNRATDAALDALNSGDLRRATELDAELRHLQEELAGLKKRQVSRSPKKPPNGGPAS